MTDNVNTESIDLQLKPIAEAIRRLRRDAGLTQAALSQKSGVSRQEISAMENARFSGSIRKVNQVLLALRHRLAVEVFRYPTLDEIDELFNND